VQSTGFETPDKGLLAHLLLQTATSCFSCLISVFAAQKLSATFSRRSRLLLAAEKLMQGKGTSRAAFTWYRMLLQPVK
jgi:hypothetical protein